MPSTATVMQIAATVLVSTTGGFTLAAETVGNMRTDTYGPAIIRSVEDCAQCSDRQRGAVWAESEKIASIESCANTPWQFRKGCEDYLSSGGQ